MRRGEPNSRRFTYYESKRCMLASVNLGADFSVGCAGKRIGYSLSATHPHPAIRESMQNRSYGLLRMHLPRRLVNKLLVDAPNPSGWHHAHGVDPVEKGK